MVWPLPFESLYNLWLTRVPEYEWEAVPASEGSAADDPGTACSAPDASLDPDSEASGMDPGKPAQPQAQPQMQLVFKGMKMVAVTVWDIRENPLHELLKETEEDKDREREIARKPRLPQPQGPSAGEKPAGEKPATDATESSD